MWYDHVWHVLDFYFRWPYGGVWGNVWAILPTAILTALGAWWQRDRLGRAIAAWFHKHHTAHLEKLEKEKGDQK